MKVHKDENYKPLKLGWKTRVLLSAILDGALVLNMTEGAVEGWNYESMRKQALLNERFEKKYEAALRNSKAEYMVDGRRVDSYLNQVNSRN